MKNKNIRRICETLKDGELEENNTVGKTDVINSKKTVKIYNLDMLIAV